MILSLDVVEQARQLAFANCAKRLLRKLHTRQADLFAREITQGSEVRLRAISSGYGRQSRAA